MNKRLIFLRTKRSLSQSALATKLNMSQSGYSKYETGENDVPISILIRLAEIYGTSTDYLLGRTDDPRPYPPSKK